MPVGKRGPKAKHDQYSAGNPAKESSQPPPPPPARIRSPSHSTPPFAWQEISPRGPRTSESNNSTPAHRWQTLSETIRVRCVSRPLNALAKGCLELFFEYLYPLVPVVDEMSLRDTLNYLATGYGHVTSLELQFALLTAVCAEAALFLPQSLFPEGSVVGPIFLEASLTALSSFTGHDLEEPCAASIVVRYFHSNCLHASAKPKLSWHCFGEAIRVAQALNLQAESSYEGLPSVESELRRRAFWLVFLGDKSAATLNNRPITIHKYSYDVGITAAYPSEHADDAMAGFNACIRLWNCLAEILLQIRLLRDKQYYQDSTPHSLSLEDRARLDFLLVQYATCLDDLPLSLQFDGLRNEADRTADKRAIIQTANLQVTHTCLRLIITQRLEELGYWTDNVEILALRKTEICRDMLRVIQEAPFWALQVNGEPCVEKIRLVGASMLSLIDLNETSPLSSRARRDFMILLDILTRLDSKASDALRAGSSWDF